MKKRLLPGLITLLAAQPAFSLDLVEAYEQALSYDYGIASALAQFQAQQAASDVSKSTLLPQVGAFAEASHINQEPKDRDSTNNRPLSYGVQLTQPIFRANNWFQYDPS